ncbi:N-formylglutamate amidohydrolase, partial [bacterium]|nr:N-formylglutamate amidohydrolase [bacterium]
MILHIPHSSTNTQDYEINNACRELLRMTDHFTDELFVNENASKIVFKLSRLICDVERFEDDEQEAMSLVGMGVCYTKDTEGGKLRDVTLTQKKEIIENYYKPHHKKLSDAVDAELQAKSSALIVDCHSFPDEAYHFNSDFGQKRPDICIGTDSFHTPKALMERVKVFFLSKGYDTRVDAPYSGTMVPLKHYKKDVNVHSIMIELNRKLYMDECGYKTEHYDILKEELTEL